MKKFVFTAVLVLFSLTCLAGTPKKLNAAAKFKKDVGRPAGSTIQELNTRKPSDGNFNTEGYIVKIHTCPSCPKGAACKPCMGNNIVISEENKILNSYSLRQRELIVFTSHFDSKQFELGKKYVFLIDITDKKTTRGSLNDIELISYRPVDPAPFCGDGVCNDGKAGKEVGFLRHVCTLDCWEFIEPDPCGTLVPRSPVINSVRLADDAPLLPLSASSGDLWRNTVAQDGNLYIAWGDGLGIQQQRTSTVLGVGKISGSGRKLTGENTYLDNPFPVLEGQSNSKVMSLLAIDDTIYMTAGEINGDFTTYIAYSRDHGVTWTKLDTPPTWPIGAPAFINMGKNYSQNTDGYVYGLIPGIIPGSTDSKEDNQLTLHLTRVKKEKILDYNSYEYYSGMRNNKPDWSLSAKNVAALVPAGSIEKTELPTAIYHPGIKRYLMITPQNVFDAPNPWGPWTCAGTYLTTESPEEWQGGYYPIILPNDLMSGKEYDSTYFFFAIAGQADFGIKSQKKRIPYKFNLGKIIMNKKKRGHT